MTSVPGCTHTRAALDLFGIDAEAFRAVQFDQLGHWSPEELRIWQKLNTQVKEDVEVIQTFVSSSSHPAG